MLKGQILSDKLNIGVEPELKKRLQKLKSQHKVDVPRWIRRLIYEHIDELEQNVAGINPSEI